MATIKPAKQSKYTPKKYLKKTVENSSSGVPSEISDTTPLPSVPVETAIENHAVPNAPSLLDRAKQKLSEMGSDETDAPVEEKPKSNWRRYAQSGKKEKSKAELATLLSTVIILLLALWGVPDTVKPTSTEVDAFSEHLSNIVLRHIDLSGALTGDVLDAIGIAAVLGSWLTRVGPEMRAIAEENQKNLPPGSVTVMRKPKKVATAPVEEPPSKTPIESLSPATKHYLDELANEPTPDLP